MRLAVRKRTIKAKNSLLYPVLAALRGPISSYLHGYLCESRPIEPGVREAVAALHIPSDNQAKASPLALGSWPNSEWLNRGKYRISCNFELMGGPLLNRALATRGVQLPYRAGNVRLATLNGTQPCGDSNLPICGAISCRWAR